jgi:hypothetical protein
MWAMSTHCWCSLPVHQGLTYATKTHGPCRAKGRLLWPDSIDPQDHEDGFPWRMFDLPSARSDRTLLELLGNGRELDSFS